MPYGLYGFWDPTYFLVLIGAVICLLASARVKSTFHKYSQVRSMSGMTGAMAAERILHKAGIHDVQIQHVSGSLTDHYDPKHKVLRLSDSVYGSASVAAVGVAAHECGHAIQHHNGYVPLQLRAAIVPVANIGSTLAAVLFQLVTLPVEFNASGRALRILGDTGILGTDEVQDTRKVLSAAALTYVAGAAAAILQLLRLVLLFGGRRDDD